MMKVLKNMKAIKARKRSRHQLLPLCLSLCLSAGLLSACGQTAAPSLTSSDTEQAHNDAAEATAQEAAKQSAPTADSQKNTQTDYGADSQLPEDSIGAVSFMPNEKGYSMVYGDDTLHIYFMRQNVLPGTGRMNVLRYADDAVVETIDLQNEASCTPGEQDSMFYLLGWEGGTHFVIHLKETPSSGELYYVNLEEGAFTSQDGSIRSKAVSDNTTWCYGIADYGVIPKLPSGSEVYVGDTLTANILIRQPAAYAKIENYDENRVRFNEKEFEKDGKLDIRIYQIGEDPFTVTFYDNEDNPIGSIRLCYTASMPPEPEQELPQKTITNL